VTDRDIIIINDAINKITNCDDNEQNMDINYIHIVILTISKISGIVAWHGEREISKASKSL
jgi:hypothetical protein